GLRGPEPVVGLLAISTGECAVPGSGTDEPEGLAALAVSALIVLAGNGMSSGYSRRGEMGSEQLLNSQEGRIREIRRDLTMRCFSIMIGERGECCMSQIAERFLNEALQLPGPGRADMAEKLFDSLEPETEETLDAAWGE